MSRSAPETQLVVVAEPAQQAEVQQAEWQPPSVGQWFWVKKDRVDDDDDEPGRWVGCVVHVGSNYVRIEAPPRGTHRSTRWTRVHFDQLDQCCELIPNADEFLAGKVAAAQTQLAQLMAEAQRIVGQLGLGVVGALPVHVETTALARLGAADEVGAYKQALALAKEKQLPDLFKEIEQASANLANWMAARMVPLKAQCEAVKGTIKAIDDRIFSVELYAGLVESVELVREGRPADMGEPIHLMQRRHYMDEECLARYEAGGMRFKNIGEFDEWMCRPENFDRILPFPRTIVAFRVRREQFDQERETGSSRMTLRNFIQIDGERRDDKRTFLMIRNGEQLHCLETGIDFEEQLFPDMRTRAEETDRLWAKCDWHKVTGIVSEREYEEMRRQDAADLREWRRKRNDPKDPMASAFRPTQRTRDYHPFDHSSVWYDDIAQALGDEQKRHNRLVLVLQGLLDRSPVLAPHPPWQLATRLGFESALRLVYDDSLALVSGPQPDFEAYRRRLNASIKVGSMTVGQQDAWMRREADRENARRDRDPRDRGHWRPRFYTPMGDPGPGRVARVSSMRGRKCIYRWRRERTRWSRWGNDVPASIMVPPDKLLHLDAYKAGDYRQFYDDPRTRALYETWAPYLLTAEDYLAGKLTVEGNP